MRIDVEIGLILAIFLPPFVPDTINSAQEGQKIQTAVINFPKKVFLEIIFMKESHFNEGSEYPVNRLQDSFCGTL
jgi:hypothetical protein